jgi:shikimate dehydrogenase
MAERSGSVNTLRFRDGLVEGHSTDAAAAKTLVDGVRFDPVAPILILGAGGAAAAVLIALEGRAVYLAARRDDLANQLAARAGYEVRVVPFGSPIPGAIVVNATPLGMKGESLPSGVVDIASGLIDLAYGPLDPPATVEARRIGLPLVDGVEFLARQAGESFSWWTGKAAPLEVMLEAAKNG